MHTGFF